MFECTTEKVKQLYNTSFIMLSESYLQYSKNKLEYLSLTDMACLV
jgi:hypothetical protein